MPPRVAKNAVRQEERVTPGGVAYRLLRTRVKNYNLRLGAAGEAIVSAPLRADAGAVDAFVDSHRAWLEKARGRQARRDAALAAPPPDPAAALAAFTAMSEQVYPAFARILGGRPPELVVKDMRSRWGVCYPQKRRIALALRLYQMPPEAQVYVVVHEYCHFLVPDHSAAFWREVERLLPDWRARRALLRW